MIGNNFLESVQKYIEELRVRFIRVAIPFAIFFIFFIAFSLKTIKIRFFLTPLIPRYAGGMPLFYPYPDFFHNMAAQFIQVLERHIVPVQMKIITLKPADAVVADFYAAIFLSIVFTMPIIVDQFGKFLRPALKKSEAQALGSVAIPAAILFALGSFFGMYVFAPELFKIFYGFDVGLGTIPYLGLTSFINFVIIYLVSFGLSFELPVVMVGLTRAHLVTSEFWRSHWRHAVVVSLVFGMIFSPGVTGFTMVVMAVPMIILYFGGIYFARRVERRSERAEPEAAFS